MRSRSSQLFALLSSLLCAATSISCHGDARDPAPNPTPLAQVPPPPASSILTLGALDPNAALAPVPPTTAPAVPQQPLTVVSFGPQGRTDGGSTISVRFNQAVGALELTDDQKNVPELRIDPPLKGKAAFQSPELLVFETGDQLIDATRYKISLNGPVIAQSGARYDKPLAWEFETPRPKVQGIHPTSGTVDVSRTTPLFLTFDHKVAISEVKAHVRARAFASGGNVSTARQVPVSISDTTEEDSKKYDFYWNSSDRGTVYTVKPQPLWPPSSEVIVEVTPGLLSTVGPLPLDTPFESRFRTIDGLKLEKISCDEKQHCGLEPIAVHFNNPVPDAQWKRITMTPQPLDFQKDGIDSYDSLGSKEQTLSGIFMPGTKYTIRIPADLTDGYGQKLGRAITHNVIITRAPMLELHHAQGTLPALAKQTIGVVSRHVQSLRLRAIVLEDQEYLSLTMGRPRKQTTPQPEVQHNDDEAEEVQAEDLVSFPWPSAGRPQLERTIPLTPQGPTDWSSIAIDLAELSGQARRAILVEVSSAEVVPASRHDYPAPHPVRGLYRITDLGPVMVRSQPRQAVFLSRISTREPVAGAQVLMLDQKKQSQPKLVGTTDANGLLELPGLGDDYLAKGKLSDLFIFAEDKTNDRAYLVAQRNTGRPYSSYSYSRGRYRNHDHIETNKLRPGERLILRIVTERDAYLPGDRVRAVGWAAIDTPYTRSGLMRPQAETPVEWQLKDSHNRVVSTVHGAITREGKFWAELQIPPANALGYYQVSAELLGGTTTVGVKVEDFRIPEFSVTASVSASDLIASPDPKVERIPTVRAVASYYFGGPVKIRRASYHHGCSAISYRPPGLEYDWTVGDYHWESRHTSSALDLNLSTQRSEADSGRLAFKPSRDQSVDGWPSRCTVDVTAGDASFQSYGARTEYQVHPAPYYLAIRTPWSTEEGQPLSIPVRAVSYDGKRAAAHGVTILIERRWREPVFKIDAAGKKVFDREEEKKETIRKTTLELPQAGADALLKLTPQSPGEYDVYLRGVASDHAVDARTKATFHVHPKTPKLQAIPPRPQPRALELLLSNTKLKPGDGLDVTVRAPWTGTHGLLLLSRNGLRELRPLSLSPTEDARIKLPVDDTWFPEVSLQALVVRPGGNGLPSIDTRSAETTMTQDHRRLKVQVDAPITATAGATVPIVVRVTDDNDRPIKAGDTTRVALWAVDEAVLDLTGYKVPELMPSFVPNAEVQITTQHDFNSLMLPYIVQHTDPWLQRGSVGYGRGMGGMSGRSSGAAGMGMGSTTHTRQKFEITPLFLADVAVGPEGVTKVDAKLPDNLTTFRITAVASARLVDSESPGRFGMNDARLRVTAPLIVRPALPRLLRPGDNAEAAALVNNLGGPAGQLEVTVRVLAPEDSKEPQRAIKFLGNAQTKMAIEPGAVVRVPFNLLAEQPGRPEVELVAILTPNNPSELPLRDAVKVPVPVELERTIVERVATYGTLATDQPVAIPLRVPRDANPQLGGMTLSASTSLIGDLEGAARALVSYPYGCVEQTASKLLPLIAIAELRKNGLLRGEIGNAEEFMAAGLERILSMQTGSGGFSYWPGGREPNAYATAYALWVLHLARGVGVAVPQDSLKRAADYLEELLKKDGAFADSLEQVHSAIAVYTLSQMARKVDGAIEKLYTNRAELPVFGRAFLLMAMLTATPGDARTAMLTEELFGTLAELPASAHVVERVRYSLDTIFYSEARSDAIVLQALLQARPDHPVLIKLVRGLMERRAGNAWRNTQENAYSLFALSEFARRFEKEPPNLVGSAWLGQTLLAQVRIQERTAQPHTALVPMAKLFAPLATSQSDATPPIILQRTGTGRMYYRVGMEWTPKDASPPPRAQGIRITRSIRDRNRELKPQDVLVAGEPVAFDLVIENRAPMHYVAIDVPLPAGLEAIQKLGAGGRVMPFPGSHGSFVSHEEAWKDRAVLFADRLQPGIHHHTLFLRATTPGRYTLPPAHAEAMYAPEVYGRSTGGVVEVR